MKVKVLFIALLTLVMLLPTATVAKAQDLDTDQPCGPTERDCIQLELEVPCAYPVAYATLFSRKQGYLTSKPVKMQVFRVIGNSLVFGAAFHGLDMRDSFIGQVIYQGIALQESREVDPPFLLTWLHDGQCTIWATTVTVSSLAQ